MRSGSVGRTGTGPTSRLAAQMFFQVNFTTPESNLKI